MNSPSPSHLSLPKPSRGRSSLKLIVLAVTVVGVLVVSTALFTIINGNWGSGRSDLILHSVKYEKLDLTIVERGTMESANNNEIVCRVKSGLKGGGFATSIKWIIDDGSLVKKDDLLIELDKSGLEDERLRQQIILAQAEALAKQARANLAIVRSQNKSDLESARVVLKLAEIQLKKYQEGDYPQARKEILGRKEKAESNLELWRDRRAWSMRMLKKGYLSPSKVQAEQLSHRAAQIEYDTIAEELRVLELTRLHSVTDFGGQVKEAERALERVKIQTKAMEDQARVDMESKEAVADQERLKIKEILDQIAKCTIKSPQDGMVVYYIQQSRRSSREVVVAQGEPVVEGQKLMRIPDLSKMQVVTKIHEALISRIQIGQPALIRIDAFPNRPVKGHVTQVATVASQADWYSADVKVYETEVSIDEYGLKLRPGMSAEVTILVDKVLDNVLTIPVHAIVGSAELGKHRKCYVQTDNGTEERQITLGLSNDRMAEVRSGLQEGDKVVTNPKVLVGDAEKTREPYSGGRGGAKPKKNWKKDGPPQRAPAKSGRPEVSAPTDKKSRPKKKPAG